MRGSKKNFLQTPHNPEYSLLNLPANSMIDTFQFTPLILLGIPSRVRRVIFPCILVESLINAILIRCLRWRAADVLLNVVSIFKMEYEVRPHIKLRNEDFCFLWHFFPFHPHFPFLPLKYSLT